MATKSASSVLLTALFLLAGCSHYGCESVWSSPEVQSPNERWSARVTQYACSNGLTSWEDKNVELTSNRSSQDRVTVLTPSGQWTDPAMIGLHWVGENLRIVVPNRTDLYNSLAHYKGVTISVEYLGNDPADRAKWRDWKKHNQELRDNVRSEPPPLPTSEQQAIHPDKSS